MSEYIERANALQYYQLICRGIACKDCRLHEYNHCKIELFLTNLPAADVMERKRGKWIGTVAFYLKCSECGACIQQPNEYNEVFLANAGKMNFCPNCGAEMSQGGDAAR